MTEEELGALVEYTFPGGSCTIEPYEHWLMSDAIGAKPRESGCAHPMYAYYVGLAGAGISLDELFALAGAKAADSVMFGECSIEIRTPLRIGGSYDVSGRIVATARKSGQRAGIFDTVTFRLDVLEGGELAASTTSTFVFPRGAGS